jgi:hypothetical protein
VIRTFVIWVLSVSAEGRAYDILRERRAERAAVPGVSAARRGAQTRLGRRPQGQGQFAVRFDERLPVPPALVTRLAAASTGPTLTQPGSDHFIALLELPEQTHTPLRTLVEREAKAH